MPHLLPLVLLGLLSAANAFSVRQSSPMLGTFGRTKVITHLMKSSSAFVSSRSLTLPAKCRVSHCMRRSTLMQTKKKEDDSKNNNNNNNKKKFKAVEKRPFRLDPVTELWEFWLAWYDTAYANLQERLQELANHLSRPLTVTISFFWPANWSNFFLSFAAGACFMSAVILVPAYTHISTLSQPVALFETILADLESTYVDEVNTQKLFETGVSAMLRSLDPYTEFEGATEARELNESIDGKYGGVGLVIAGTPAASQNTAAAAAAKLLPKDAKLEQKKLFETDDSASLLLEEGVEEVDLDIDDNDDGDDDEDFEDRQIAKRQRAKARKQGIRVVTAFEGYAFDYGMRVGDKLVAIDDMTITQATTIEDVRNSLRGEPGTSVSIAFERDGIDGVQTVAVPRTVVRLRDVKLATLIGNPRDGMGYIQLSGFTTDAGREMRNAIRALQEASEEATNGERSLQGLVLDLRGNPGGLLTSAVDVASLLVPKGSDIVSARGRGFPGILYRSRVDPILSSSTKLAVLVNGNTASAAEIVSGAVQDLDVGVIIGSDRTFGKGLVQNVEELPYNTALKYTVAKYYTPSGRCIQAINYKEGGGLSAKEGKYRASKVADKDRAIFYTRSGRPIKDAGGIEADFKVDAPKASALEVTLLRAGLFNDFASEWSKKNELTKNFNVDEDTFKQFQNFVADKQRKGDIQLEELYNKPLGDLKKALKLSGYSGSAKELEQLQASIVKEVQKDFEKYRADIKEDIGQSILARYLPESMLIERGVKNDRQVQEAVKLLASRNTYDKLLAKGSSSQPLGYASSLNMAATDDTLPILR